MAGKSAVVERRRAVWRLTLQGFSVREIAEALSRTSDKQVSIRTVESDRRFLRKQRPEEIAQFDAKEALSQSLAV